LGEVFEEARTAMLCWQWCWRSVVPIVLIDLVSMWNCWCLASNKPQNVRWSGDSQLYTPGSYPVLGRMSKVISSLMVSRGYSVTL
jgi:hypothetical protein